MEHWSHMLILFNLTHLALFSTNLKYVLKQSFPTYMHDQNKISSEMCTGRKSLKAHQPVWVWVHTPVF